MHLVYCIDDWEYWELDGVFSWFSCIRPSTPREVRTTVEIGAMQVFELFRRRLVPYEWGVNELCSFLFESPIVVCLSICLVQFHDPYITIHNIHNLAAVTCQCGGVRGLPPLNF